MIRQLIFWTFNYWTLNKHYKTWSQLTYAFFIYIFVGHLINGHLINVHLLLLAHFRMRIYHVVIAIVCVARRVITTPHPGLLKNSLYILHCGKGYPGYTNQKKQGIGQRPGVLKEFCISFFKIWGK